jgi:hypothetical protein
MTAASILERVGHTGLAVLSGGPVEYAAANGTRLVEGLEDAGA